MKLLNTLRRASRKIMQRSLLDARCLTAARKILEHLPLDAEHADFSVHFLTGSHQTPMTVISAMSFFFQSQVHAPLYFHDDGTLTRKDARTLASFFPQSNIIARSHADDKLDKLGVGNTLSNARATSPPFFLKLIDVFELSESPNIIFIDSDVLFFKKPVSLLYPRDPSKWIFNKDIESAYMLSEKEALEHYGVELCQRLNAGLWRAPKTAYSRPILENFLRHERYEEFRSRRPHVAEQTMAAMLASATTGADYLPRSYDVDLTRSPSSSTCKHYVGEIRDQFLREGVPSVLQTLETNAALDGE